MRKKTLHTEFDIIKKKQIVFTFANSLTIFSLFQLFIESTPRGRMDINT